MTIIKSSVRTISPIRENGTDQVDNPQDKLWNKTFNTISDVLHAEHPEILITSAIICGVDSYGRSHLFQVNGEPDCMEITTTSLENSEHNFIDVLNHMSNAYVTLATAFNTRPTECTVLTMDRSQTI